MKKVTVLGTGGWGTAIAIHLRNQGCSVTLWGRDPEYVARINDTRVNERYLPGATIPPEITIDADEEKSLSGACLVLEAIPLQSLRAILKRIEGQTLMRGSEIIRDVLGDIPVGALSGPSHCEEVVHGRPTGVVIASTDPVLSDWVQSLFTGRNFRAYTNPDLIGVELGGAVKNVIAIAAGICDGLGYGDNSKAALVTRGLSELVRLGQAMGAEPQTFLGLAGVGDLYTTCASPYGRNRAVGERLGSGETLEDIRKSMKQIAEGVETTKSLQELSLKYQVEMPICEEIYAVLFHQKSPAEAVRDLMSREPKAEHEVPGK
jgi:glycerol-3-phosphate dehydrogenase (NAD(P)+)